MHHAHLEDAENRENEKPEANDAPRPGEIRPAHACVNVNMRARAQTHAYAYTWTRTHTDAMHMHRHPRARHPPRTSGSCTLALSRVFRRHMMIHMHLPHVRKEMAQEFSLYAGLEHLSAERRSQKAERRSQKAKRPTNTKLPACDCGRGARKSARHQPRPITICQQERAERQHRHLNDLEMPQCRRSMGPAMRS
jgi:hypothetical protein